MNPEFSRRRIVIAEHFLQIRCFCCVRTIEERALEALKRDRSEGGGINREALQRQLVLRAAVSYTHLDVYTRQGGDRAARAAQCVWF